MEVLSIAKEMENLCIEISFLYLCDFSSIYAIFLADILFDAWFLSHETTDESKIRWRLIIRIMQVIGWTWRDYESGERYGPGAAKR